MVRRGGVALGLAVAIALVWSAPAFASVHVSLALTGVSAPGPSIAPVLTLQSYSWGTGYGSHTGGYSGRTQVRTPSVSGGEITVTAASAASLVNLENAAIAGRRFANGTLTSTRSGDSSPYLTIGFTNMAPTSVEVTSNTSGSGLPAARITFVYTSVELHYAAAPTCSIARQSWLGMSRVTPAVEPATGGSALDALTDFLPVQLGAAGPGQVSVGSPSQADTLLAANGANGIANLRAQTLAARLNIGAGGLDPASVSSELTQADGFLGADRPSDWGSLSAATQSSVLNLVNELAAANHPATGCPLVPNVATLIPPPVPPLAGLVTDVCTRAPVGGLNVTASAPGLPGPISLAGGPGEFTGPTLPAGTYTLTIAGNLHNTFTLPGVEIPAVQTGGTGGFTSGLQLDVRMEPTAGCGNPGPINRADFTGGLFDACTQEALSGGTMSLEPPAGGTTITTTATGNWFTAQSLITGRYGISESAPDHSRVLFTGGVLPTVQMPAQPSTFADGSAARYGIIAVLEPEPVTGGC